MRITARAPAKLVLFGEYAVLRGAPAVVAAVDRCATVTLRARADGRWSVQTDLAGEAPVALRWSEAERLVPQGADGGPPWARAVATAIEGTLAAARVKGRDLPGAEVRVETAPLFAGSGEGKLGLGSSAAVVVALAAALRRWLEDLGATPAPAEPGIALAQDLATHASLQGGGSGVDVAASLHGGVIAYARGPEGAPLVERLRWPEGLWMRCVWTGRGASTAAFLRRLRACADEHPAEHAAAMARLEARARDALAAFRDARPEAVVALARAYHDAMDHLGRACAVAIVSEAHRALADVAQAAGAAYKPSGAGGGDVGVLFGLSADVVSSAAARASADGYHVLDLAVQDAGVTVEAA